MPSLHDAHAEAPFSPGRRALVTTGTIGVHHVLAQRRRLAVQQLAIPPGMRFKG